MTDDHNPRKRRRLDATATLSKPFKSPLRRPPTESSNLTPLTSHPATQHETQPASPDNSSQLLDQATPTPRLSSVARRKNIPGSGLTTPIRSPADPALLDLQRQQLSLQSRIITLKADHDTIRQALRIEASDKDTELEALIIKWRRAGQDAAEEVFANSQERVVRMGGMAAWMERSKRDAVRWDEDDSQVQHEPDQRSEPSAEDEETRDEVSFG
ncbi:hypothetical protein N7466_003016 [Penicillium verhagenii]|uniref:uncharacterized protein n=1 Tax=Penicillium verhagenii TaxID=1562060 RepID=UPI0025458923|nr:uncharacterized protein N7466_003016 [Penicillium verhagenii]KAJ5936566.1 hypothetical protein N7466_003016 [Penicillium verhagenii]